MDSIDTTSQSVTSGVFNPSYVLLEAELPNSGGKEFLPIRNYNPKLVRPKKEEKKKKEEEDEDDDIGYADQKVIRIKSRKVVDIQSVSRKDLFFHPVHGYLKVVQIKHGNEDDEESPVSSIKCCKLDSKGKKSDEEIELTKRQLKELTNEFRIPVKAHFSSGETLEVQLKIPVRPRVTIDDILKPFEETTMSSFKVFVNGEYVDRKKKIQKVLNDQTKVLLYSASEQSKSKPEGIRWFCRFPRHITDDY